MEASACSQSEPGVQSLNNLPVLYTRPSPQLIVQSDIFVASERSTSATNKIIGMSHSHSSFFPSASATATSALALVPHHPHHRLAFTGPVLPSHIPLHFNAKSKGPTCDGVDITPSPFDVEPPARNDCYESFRPRLSKHSRCRRNNMFLRYSSLSSDDANISSFSDDADDDNDGTETGVLGEESAVADTGYASEAVEALDDAALARGEGDDDEKGRTYEDSDDIFAGEEGVMSDYSGIEEDDDDDDDDDDSYFGDEEDDDDDGFEFDETALEELDLFDDEQEAILNELELAEDLGMLDDDEFLIKIDDDLVIKARRSGAASAGESGNDDEDDDIVGGGDDDVFLMEELELAGAFDEDGRDYRAIDDDTLLEILGLPDEEVIGGLDEALALEGEEEIIFQATDKDLKKAKQYFDDVFEEQSRAKTTEIQLEKPSKDKDDDITPQFSFQPLESALELGVVPTEAGVGSGALPGDFGFDPFGFSEKDWFKQTQRALLSIVPERKYEEDEESSAGQEESGYDGGAIPKSLRVKTFDDMEKRPASLIIRDYREAEIRHGRLVSLMHLPNEQRTSVACILLLRSIWHDI